MILGSARDDPASITKAECRCFIHLLPIMLPLPHMLHVTALVDKSVKTLRIAVIQYRIML